MKKLLIPISLCMLLLIGGCSKTETNMNNQKTEATKCVSQTQINSVIDELVNKYGDRERSRIEKGVTQIGNLWQIGAELDGTETEFHKFCVDNYVASAEQLDGLFESLQTHFEVIVGHYNKISLDLKRPTAVEGLSVNKIDEIIAGYEPSASFISDFFNNKIAFIVGLNFPYFTLKEKKEFGESWSRKQWAYARLGDYFTTRIPANLQQKYGESLSNADFYISNYNICMGYLLAHNGKELFPKDMKLISHWNLRDEIKSNYGQPDGLEKQKMIQQVMERIINQDIPKEVINSTRYTWNPYSNKVFDNGKEVKKTSAEPNVRYQHLLNHFQIEKQMDVYRPAIGNAINATFDVAYEMPVQEVENLFISFISSPQVKEVSEIIKKRLGRDLQPFDIWYDGFKSRSTIDQSMLDKKTKALYPNTAAVHKDLPNIMQKLGFSKQKADEVVSRVQVDPSKGAGHAWGADMKGEKAHLRTRIGKDGMDYKGYNIAVHEFGHNVEQTLSLYDVDYWFLRGVPNTAFTEAWAFVFQAKDLDLLGIKNEDKDKEALEVLDKFWGAYEIMGVSLVDQRVWKWMYEHPNCNAEDLKNAVIQIAKDIWNAYYAPIFNMKDCTILAIYSHMIDYPLYLSMYPIGHLIEFQMSEYMKGKNIGTEMTRICTQGRLIPDVWMQGAVGSPVSAQPILNATERAVQTLNKE
ncbi:MAG: hypothetical protein LBO69_03820 [Ignavibacteria bacterium]|jgi:hypothetical protein|nr:hypothetical protein [Ignavibacteria bacterium]